MVIATRNGTKSTDLQMRERVETVKRKQLWTWDRLAVEIGVTRPVLDDWLDGITDVAPSSLRLKLHRFLEKWPEPAPIDLRAERAAEPTGDTAPPEPEETEAADEPTVDDEVPNVLVAETAPGLWSLPVGFEAIAPAPSAHAARPTGIGIHKHYERAAISAALFKALGSPERVLVACNPLTKELVVAGEREGLPAMKLTKSLHISKSVALRAKAMGIPTGFYEATDAGDGTWRIKLAA